MDFFSISHSYSISFILGDSLLSSPDVFFTSDCSTYFPSDCLTCCSLCCSVHFSVLSIWGFCNFLICSLFLSFGIPSNMDAYRFLLHEDTCWNIFQCSCVILCIGIINNGISFFNGFIWRTVYFL